MARASSQGYGWHTVGAWQNTWEMNTCCFFFIPASRPDLICGWFFGVCLFLFFFILLLILTIDRTKIGAPLGSLLAQRLLRL